MFALRSLPAAVAARRSDLRLLFGGAAGPALACGPATQRSSPRVGTFSQEPPVPGSTLLRRCASAVGFSAGHLAAGPGGRRRACRSAVGASAANRRLSAPADLRSRGGSGRRRDLALSPAAARSYRSAVRAGGGCFGRNGDDRRFSGDGVRIDHRRGVGTGLRPPARRSGASGSVGTREAGSLGVGPPGGTRLESVRGWSRRRRGRRTSDQAAWRTTVRSAAASKRWPTPLNCTSPSTWSPGWWLYWDSWCANASCVCWPTVDRCWMAAGWCSPRDRPGQSLRKSVRPSTSTARESPKQPARWESPSLQAQRMSPESHPQDSPSNRPRPARPERQPARVRSDAGRLGFCSGQPYRIRCHVRTAGLCLSTVTFSHSSTFVDPSTVTRVRLGTGVASP